MTAAGSISPACASWRRAAGPFRFCLLYTSQAGYTGVEFAGYDGIAGPEMRRLLASLGLRGTGSQIAYDALRDDLDGCVRSCLEAGITSAACPGCEMNDRDQALAQEMCIRDRLMRAEPARVMWLDGEKWMSLAVQFRDGRCATLSVSYTHLGVLEREIGNDDL